MVWVTALMGVKTVLAGETREPKQGGLSMMAMLALLSNSSSGVDMLKSSCRQVQRYHPKAMNMIHSSV